MAAAVHSHAVPVLVSDAGAPVLDNLQDLLRRKREIEKNKSKYHLTEADCNLILTNANEYSFTDGQVIMEEGHENSSVYRIKSGSVLLSKNGYSFCELSQGYFLGETLFLNKTHDIIEASLIAKGPVTLVEVNLSFVKKLFEVDRVLALKFYRNLASKLSSIFFAVSGNLLSPCVAKMYQESAAAASASASSIEKGSDSPASLHNSPSASSLSSSGSASSGSSSDGRRLSHSSSNSSTSSVGSMSPARTMIHCPNVPQASVEVANRRRRMSKRIAHTPFKIYILETDGKGIRTARLKNKKIKLITEAFGFKHKKTINFNKIKNIVRTSTTSITIIYDPLKAKTLFFRNTAELDEFYGLTNSLVENNSKSNLRSTPGTPLSQASNRPSPLKNSIDNHFLPLDARDDDEQRAVDKEVIIGLATRLELRKGDLLVEEGDLYQRIYTIVKGTCETLSGDRVISTIKEGEVFGEASMLHLRPAPVSIRISSATASVLIIPAYKLQDLINSNPVLAVRLYKKMAALVDKKIDRALATKRQLTTELCGAEYAKMVPERLNL